MRKLILAGIIFFVAVAANFASAAEIDRVFYLGNPDVSYPLIIAKNPEATAKINLEIRKQIQKMLDDLAKDMAENNFEAVTFSVDYQIPCNHENGLLSIILNEFVNFEKSAHPSTFLRTLNFNSSSGERITADSLSEIAKHEIDYTPAEITRKLRIYAEKNNRPLYQDFQAVTSVPDDFYFDDDLHVHFIFQQYEVAPYAVGIIDLDADATY